MPESSDPIVIIGAGHAGGRVAQTLRSLNSSADIVLFGQEEYPPYERPPLSKRLLSGEIPLEKTFLKSPDWWSEANIHLRLGVTVTGIDQALAQVILADGSRQSYSRLVITTGCRPRTIRNDAGVENTFYVRDIRDSIRLSARLKPGARLAILGAGFIGLEVAATARKAGADVTVYDIADLPLSRVSFADIGKYFVRLHERNGVSFMLDNRVVEVAKAGSGLEIHSDQRSEYFDAVVVGIGAVPNDEIARAAGLAVEDGIIVDEFGRTSDPLIFAAGDVTRHYNPWLQRHVRLESWQNAQNQSIAIAGNVLGGKVAYQEVPWVWSDQYDCNFQCSGFPLDWDSVIWRGHPADNAFIAFQMLNDIPVGFQAVNGGRDIRFAKKLVEQRVPVLPSLLADGAVNLAELVDKKAA